MYWVSVQQRPGRDLLQCTYFYLFGKIHVWVTNFTSIVFIIGENVFASKLQKN